MKNFFFLLMILTFLLGCEQEKKAADLIIMNANIWTGDEANPQAKAMAISADSILAIGTIDKILAYKKAPTKVVDAKGNFVCPSFIDSHVHLFMGGRSLLSVELRDANTPAEFTKRIADYAGTLEKGKWIVEGNWDHTLWGSELPRKEWIDPTTKDNPVAVFRLDGHMILANSAALAVAGINKNTPDIAGGEIVRDANGEPTGILKDNAMNSVLDAIPAMTPTEKTVAFKTAMEYFLANGVTTVHDVDSASTYQTAKELAQQEELAIRLYSIDPLYKWEDLAEVNRADDKWLKRGGLKGFVDGSLGSHTAVFHDAYTDTPDKSKGLMLHTKDALFNWIAGADNINLQILIHAIGDKAIHDLLNIYEKVVEKNGSKDRRWRIEHAQHLGAEDLHRFKKLGVIASMQPYHAIDDGRWAEEVIGSERIKLTYAFKSLLDADATLVFGSDWPVAPTSPLMGIYAAVTRRTLDGKNPDGWVPEQKITVEQALNAYTKNAAYAAFEEDIKGTLEVGKLADFVMIDGDLLTIDPNKIKDLKVLQTFVGGKRVY